MYNMVTPLMADSDYPYDGQSHGPLGCKSDRSKGIVSTTSFRYVIPYFESQLKAALNQSPVSLAIVASSDIFMYYNGGIITDPACGGMHLDNHGVLAVGYGSENGQDYFIVKNSWGAEWGEQGFVRLGASDACGVLSRPKYPFTS